ncbi:MAG: EAL domain-containing protein [Treponema sp.]|nr:EAL domain-containing protein [Treponema sp.]
MLNIRKVLGLESYSPAVKKYFDRSNAISSIYLSVVVITLELWMIGSVIENVVFGGKARTFSWIVSHLSSYIILLLSAVALLVFSILQLRGKNPSRMVGRIIRYGFAFICLAFGIYIGYLDYAKAHQAFAFVTMTIFVFGLFLWRPLWAFALLSISFLAFMYFCGRTATPIDSGMKINVFTMWIALLMTSVNVYTQKLMEAKQDESLDRINSYLKEKSTRDDLTGIPNMHYFRNKALSILLDPKEDISKLAFLYLDIENFKSYNDRYGFPMGNELLKKTAEAIRLVFPFSLIARFSDDHFVILAKRDQIEVRIDEVRRRIQKDENEVQLGLKAGAYIPVDRDVLASVACDRARYACNSIKKKYGRNFCEYTKEMDDEFHRKQYVINSIDRAIKENWIKVFYQPVVLAENRKLCGMEALARWEDPVYGMLPPADFVPVLEEYRQIYKLDMYILEKVCTDIFEAKKTGTYYVPISINFSRLDFELIDVVAAVDDCLNRHAVQKDMIHVEITESALSENGVQLRQAIDRFKGEGYALWLDDFGSGYSGLNVLQDFEFDMMKIDMKFLHNFSENEKIRPILKSIVSLAKEIGMQTLTEGVETEEIFEFLRSIGCERMQGYLFGKPMPKEQALDGITTGKITV